MITLTPQQVGIILALEPVLQDPAANLTLVCPRCVREGRAWLDTGNGRGDVVWKIDCGCQQRRADPKADTGSAPSHWGDLLWAAQSVLPGAELAVRCRTRRCRTRPLELRPTESGWLVTCECARMTFRTHQPSAPAPAGASVS